MKTIGLIGGMSWESTQYYYRQINQGIRQRLGGLHSAQLLLHSVDFAPIEALQQVGDWDAAAEILSQAAQSLEAGGADFFLICACFFNHCRGHIHADNATSLSNLLRS